MKKKCLALVIVVLMIASCATIADLQAAWNKLTPDGKARIIAGGFQEQLTTLFDQGKAYVTANPDKQEIWKGQVVPCFDVANKSLRTYMISQSGTPEQIYKEIPPLIQSVITALKAMGVEL